MAEDSVGADRCRDDLPAPLHVLVAEDNPVNQRITELLLRRLGHCVDTVGDGIEAVDAVARTSYDVVLMDVQMPRLDGLEATRTIRGRRSPHQPPIVALTGGDLADDRAACSAAGMDAFLTKPLTISALAAVLTDIAADGGRQRDLDVDERQAADRSRHPDAGVDDREPADADTDERQPADADADADARSRHPHAGVDKPTPADDDTDTDTDTDTDERTPAREVPAELPRSGDATSREELIGRRLDELAGPDPLDEDVDLFTSIIRSFIERSPSLVDDLADAMLHSSIAAVEHQAHRLKGSAANLGGADLAGLLERIESQSRLGEPSSVGELEPIRAELAELRRSLATVASSLESRSGSGPAAAVDLRDDDLADGAPR